MNNGAWDTKVNITTRGCFCSITIQVLWISKESKITRQLTNERGHSHTADSQPDAERTHVRTHTDGRATRARSRLSARDKTTQKQGGAFSPLTRRSCTKSCAEELLGSSGAGRRDQGRMRAWRGEACKCCANEGRSAPARQRRRRGTRRHTHPGCQTTIWSRIDHS